MIQCQVINYVLNTGDTSLFLFNNIGSEYFSDYPNEFYFIKKHIDEYGKVPDKVTFLNKFPDFDILEVNESPTYLINELYSDYNTRFLAKTFNKIKDLLISGKTDEALAVYSQSSDEMIHSTHLETVDILTDTSRYDDYIDRTQDFAKYYVKTGFKELDELIGGWDKSEELATIVARPGVGKSWILLKVAVAALEQGLRVGIYSGEMSSRKVGYRLDTWLSHISNSALLRGNVEVQNEYKKYIDSLKDKYTGCIKVLTPSMINGPAGVTALRAFIEKEKLDILCIDQHSLLEDDRKARNPVEKASNISKDLKNLQVLKQIPIIAVSQQNRSSTENGTSTSNVAQSDRIAQDSTILLFLEQKDNVLTLDLVKARDAVNNKKIQYMCDFDKGILTYLPNNNSSTPSSCEDLKNEYDMEYSTGANVF